MDKKTIVMVGMALILGICIGWWLGTSKTCSIQTQDMPQPQDIVISERLKILEPSIKYTGYTFSFAIMNDAEGSITDANVSLSRDCIGTYMFSTDGHMGPGEVNHERITDCSTKFAGQPFRVDFNVTYIDYFEDLSIRHIKNVTIKGFAE